MARTICRWLLGLAYLVAAWFHIVAPGPFLSIMPAWVPRPEDVVFWTGIAEAAGAFALLQGQGRLLRKAAGWGLAAYALCVWPANVNHMMLDLARDDGGLGLWYHLPRLAFQPVLIWAALWVSGALPRRG
jgi:uncharacterized membrane protein